MNIENIQYNLLDKNIYHDFSGREIKHGNFIGIIYNDYLIPGIAEYIKFNLMDNKSKINYGLMIHYYIHLPKCEERFHFLTDPDSKLNFSDKKISDYSNEFIYDVIHSDLNKKQDTEQHIMINSFIFNKLNISELFSKEEVNLFLDIQQKILNTKNKIYTFDYDFIVKKDKINVDDLLKDLEIEISQLI